jgi:hypothetical protein
MIATMKKKRTTRTMKRTKTANRQLLEETGDEDG